VDAVVLILAAAVEENILSYEPVITQECEFCCLPACYSEMLSRTVCFCAYTGWAKDRLYL